MSKNVFFETGMGGLIRVVGYLIWCLLSFLVTISVAVAG